jgi:hypothetical protein
LVGWLVGWLGRACKRTNEEEQQEWKKRWCTCLCESEASHEEAACKTQKTTKNGRPLPKSVIPLLSNE